LKSGSALTSTARFICHPLKRSRLPRKRVYKEHYSTAIRSELRVGRTGASPQRLGRCATAVVLGRGRTDGLGRASRRSKRPDVDGFPLSMHRSRDYKARPDPPARASGIKVQGELRGRSERPARAEAVDRPSLSEARDLDPGSPATRRSRRAVQCNAVSSAHQR
jgi:hypothetical protein